ncbi:ABC transporter ATP-binding protein/permease [Lachnospiraceae bacterium OttesenSCG-928-D06]|nr:ABC transporter ATP-binding protein/permease [Lachnospiraceae bacterium OttesenSCG-928-D06]
MVKIFKYLKKEDWFRALLCLIFVVAQVGLDLTLPDYMSEITTLVQTPGSLMSDIFIAGGKMLLCALLSFCMAVIVGFFAARIAASFSKRLRRGVFEKVEDFSMEEINGFSTASLITRSTNDITQVQMLITMGLQVMIKAPIMAVWAITKISGKNWQWTMTTAVAVAFLLVLIITMTLLALPRFRKIQALTDNLNQVTRENLTGIRVVRAYNAEKYQEKKFLKANEELTQNNLFANRVMAIMSPGMSIIMNGLTLSIYWIGAYLINQAQVMDRVSLFSDMVVFSSYAMQVVMSFMMLAMIFVIFPRASVSAKRILEVLNTTPRIKEGTVTKGKEGMDGQVEFRNVSFKYPDAADYVLKDINFTAKKGETVAFIGSTGSGKTSLINLVSRFYDATEGEVLVDGVNVKDYTGEALHNKLAYVSQKAVMFNGTIKSNVAYGDNGREQYSDEEIKKAVEIAQGAEFVEKMKDQYDGIVAQEGANLSGGQKQRLSIARAICRNAEIFLFDDSFSALDYKTDKVLRGALRAETKDVTTFIVAQRIGTIKNADKIIVLDEGEIVGMGTHKELLTTCEVYKEIALSQLSKEELDNE